ncbi:CRISPR system precrRNA processing endoribonuclease RAMP protein Cas6 [Thermodesulfovibrionales bacterium]|nr:CRISPR system precrRNA processing endoribonuclease RAMP protein Cas6 [Thermodesulfovibrionales bacterium]
MNRKVNSCYTCTLNGKCAYAHIFETSPPKTSERLRNLKEIPRPFVIEPPTETKKVYNEDEILKFNLILIGKAINYLPYFIFTFKELGKKGIGRDRGKYELQEVDNFSGEKVYDGQDDTIKNIESDIVLRKNLDDYTDNGYLSLFFLTPTRIKFRKDLVVEPEFHVILRSLLHRISALSYFHCARELEVDYKELILKAEKIKTKDSHLKWIDWERYSSRQDTRMKLGGFVGKITYVGNFKQFLPLLLVGQYTHIGKNCTFGLGKYEIVRSKSEPD